MKKISAVIITKNEAHNIGRCIDSLHWADEIVVVDSGSTDETMDICRSYGAKVIEAEWRGFGRTKQLAVNSAQHDWVFSIDADEEVTPELAGRIQSILSGENTVPGYRIKRNSFFLGKMIRFSGWNRDYQLRLFNRKYGNFNDKRVHESVKIKGTVGKIEERILHYTYPTLSSYIKKMDFYSTLGAETLKDKNKKAGIFGALFHAKIKFIKMYFINLGFLDGKAGLALAINSAFSVYLKYLKLWQMNR